MNALSLAGYCVVVFELPVHELIMSSKPIGPIRQAWYRWKALKLPWRKRFFVGLDLQGNTFWEFKDALSSNRMRRIVQYPSSTHYSEIKISPQWHQWLRHTRYDPPSLTEQSQDLIRQNNLKVLAAQADARWAAKPSFLDKPGTPRGQPVPALEVGGGLKLEAEAMEGAVKSAVGRLEDQTTGTGPKSAVKAAEEDETTPPPSNEQPEQNKRQKMLEKNDKDNPWKQARGGPSEEWQPLAWDGNMAATRRR